MRISLLSLKSLVPQSIFFRNVLTLMTSRVIAQAIPVLAAPILTRIYVPEDFGIFGLYGATTTMIALAATGTYEHAVILAKEDEDAVNVMALSLTIALGVSLLTLLCTILFNQSIAHFLKSPEASSWLYFVPLGVFLSGVYQVFVYWTMRKGHYGRIANSAVLRTIVNVILNLGMGLAHLGAIGLVIAMLIGQSLEVGRIGWLIWRDDNEKSKFISKIKITEQARRYIDFPKYNLFHTFLDGMRDSGIVFLISYFFGLHILGFYSLSLRVLRTPLSIIGSSIAQVFYQQIAEAHNAGQGIWPHLKKILLRLTILSSPLLIGLIFLGPTAFMLVFGNQWEVAGRYSQILAPWIVLNFISSPISVVPLILMKQKPFMFIGIGFNILVFATFAAVAVITGNIEMVLFFVSIIASIFLIAAIVWVIKLPMNRTVLAEGQPIS